ncbi:adenylyl-sulfate kinase [Azospirillum palustre]|uniref:Adenylyl-sulfate kinase n=1 Tax=Azospirillum palustre TaxID=2044885 RepID=A0A2B8BN72_9PROT|nr:adenylyl-sulfate kinase [Azospirillum palustre]PGH59305.1 adenylyl-sulfate kinase [Azospirillum palustre]
MGPARTGELYWVTGLSGAGKSTVATLLHDRMIAAGCCCVLLDGDRLRAVLGVEGDHHPDGRRRLAFTYARLCRELVDQGLTVVCATMSMFHDVRRWNREHIPGYREIYLKVPREELARRDAKGLYAAAAAGAIDNVIGVHIEPEEPELPDLVIDNHGTMSAEAAVERIWNAFGAGQR